MIIIDGSMGEGGGQILRSSLALSAITGESVQIQNVRAGRAKPGLMRQHLTAFLAATEVCGGHATGADIGSGEICFRPGSIRAGEYKFSVGTAGSANLVLQTVLPILLHAGAPSRVIISGGTHNPSSPPFDFLQEAYFPALKTIGHEVTGTINAYGFYPAGGGEIDVSIVPAAAAQKLVLVERGKETSRALESVISNLKGDIAKRELVVAGEALSVPEDNRHITSRQSNGPGNVLLARVDYENVRAIFASFGERGVSAEQVAKRISKTVKSFSGSAAAVTYHLADQLLLPMALAKGGEFSTLRPSLHATTNAEVIAKFTGRRIVFEETGAAYICSVT